MIINMEMIVLSVFIMMIINVAEMYKKKKMKGLGCARSKGCCVLTSIIN